MITARFSYGNVQEDIKQLIQEINEISLNNDEETLKVAAYLHNMIEQIHPFADGNNRFGRTFFNYYLMINNLPPINIYYEALEKFDETNELNSTLEFLKYEIEKI